MKKIQGFMGALLIGGGLLAGFIVLYFDKTIPPSYPEPTPVVVESSQKIEINDSNCIAVGIENNTQNVNCGSSQNTTTWTELAVDNTNIPTINANQILVAYADTNSDSQIETIVFHDPNVSLPQGEWKLVLVTFSTVRSSDLESRYLEDLSNKLNNR